MAAYRQELRALVKGRHNYVSIRRAKLAGLNAASLFPDTRESELRAILEWTERTADGSYRRVYRHGADGNRPGTGNNARRRKQARGINGADGWIPSGNLVHLPSHRIVGRTGDGC